MTETTLCAACLYIQCVCTYILLLYVYVRTYVYVGTYVRTYVLHTGVREVLVLWCTLLYLGTRLGAGERVGDRKEPSG